MKECLDRSKSPNNIMPTELFEVAALKTNEIIDTTFYHL